MLFISTIIQLPAASLFVPDAHQPHVVAIQETKIDSTITTSELFPETYMYSVYRKDRNTHDGGVLLLIHRDISHMPLMKLENNWISLGKNIRK